MVFGLTQIFPSVTSMTRALIVPLTVVIGRYLVRHTLSWDMLNGMIIAILGVVLACCVQLQAEMTKAEYNVTMIGLVLLCLSAFFQAMETMLENRLFKIEPELSSFTM